jgi:tetratricopeptide (TPR) repeat protein
MAIDELSFLATLEPEDPTLLANLAYARWQLGSGIFQRSLSRWREAEPLLLEALTMVRRAASLDRNTTYHDLRQAEILRTLGQISKVNWHTEAGINYLTEAVALLETIRLKEPSVQSHAIQLSGLYTDFSLIQALGGDLVGQRSSLERAIELLEPLVDDPSAELDLAVATGHLARLVFKNENLALSEILLDRAIGLSEKVLQRSPNDRHLATSYPRMLEDRANLRIRLGRLEEALHDYDRAVDVESVAMRAPTRIARGRLHMRLGNHRQAVTEIRETIAELPSATPAHVWIFVLKSGAQLCVECSVAVDSDEELSVQEKMALAEEYAAIAVGLLGQAVQKGFEESDFLSTNPEFESLRNRPDFQALGL